MPKLIDVEARRRELAEAVWSVIVDDGLTAVSVRSVAARAGVSTGSLRHVFPTRSDLVVHSAELMIARTAERIRSRTPTGDAVVDWAGRLGELVPLSRESRIEMEVNTALIAEAAREPGLHAVRDRAHREIAGLCRRAVDDLCPVGGASSEADRAARAVRLHALVDGLALHLLHQDAAASTEWARELLGAEVRGLGSAG